MSDKKTLIGDEMITAQLNEKSKILGISVDELIDRYIRRGLICLKLYFLDEKMESFLKL